ncbi:MAG: 1,4-alpha-glucan branching protein GlgB [Planctomycetes bacterium]|nr:1,4-alpha-glucan branching protein GlgB [Planctomycetota bacterium]
MSTFLTDYDLYLLGEGNHNRIYEKLGAHLLTLDGVAGTHFAVWAPNAHEVCVVGDFNGWRHGAFYLNSRGNSGVWDGFIPHVGVGALYKFSIHSRHLGYQVEKADPYGFAAETRPLSASKVWDLSQYAWSDAAWMARRGKANRLDAPIAIYEIHLGSWRRVPEEGNRWLTYRELATRLTDYVKAMGYTHVEFLPVSEHPLDASWGYQTVGYFAPTSRFGTPDDFRFLVDTLHQAGIGVVLDWVPAHFPRDGHGLAYFDGTHLYEHEDPRKGEHTEWGTKIFNFGRNEVCNFLISNALFWLDKYHIDGLRVDAVASMLYLDYARKEGEWIPNQYGGRENLDAVAFLRRLNERVYGEFPDTIMMAEESTAWPGVSRPTYLGGLGFGVKWDMGWMHDTLKYLSLEPIHRKYHHDQLTFRSLYAFTENFILPLSHDEVVHGKRSLLDKMPGDLWQKFANMRLLLGLMYAQPGKKLLFMGGEIGQWQEWKHDSSLEWHLLDYPLHIGLQRWTRDLNTCYRGEPAFHERDCDPSGFEWIDCSDFEQGVVSFLREGKIANDYILIAFNFTPVPRYNYHLGVPWGGRWQEILNSDAPLYGGAGQGNHGAVAAAPIPWHGRSHLLNVTVPPLAMLVFKPQS